MANLYEISEEIRNIYNSLQNGDGYDEETGEIKPEIIQALTLQKSELQDKAIDYGYVIKSFDDEIEIFDKEIKRLTALKKQMQSTQTKIKDKIKDAMIEFGIVEIKGKTLKLSIRESDCVQIDDESLLDDKFIKTKIETSPDKIAIKEAIKNGEDVQGATIIKSQNLQIR